MSVNVIRNKVYHRNDFEAHTCDLYLPTSNEEDYPVMIFFHGSSFHTGSKEMYEEWGQYLASNDIIVIAVNYTLALPSKLSYPYVLDDLRAIINYVVENANEWSADPYNIAVGGDSAGGYLASLATFKLTGSSFRIKACLSAYGVYDLIEWSDYTNQTRSDKVVRKFMGAEPELAFDYYHQASIFQLVAQAKKDPYFHAKFLVIYGTVDDVVLCKNQSEIFINKLSENNIQLEVIKIPDCDHFWFTPINEGKLLSTYPTNNFTIQVLSFLRKAFALKRMFDIYLYEV